ncbi:MULTISPECIES: DUF1858 domain-containing protein [Anaerofustis]|uniref:DUF1858 domain-containing protein n=1 Tax=Anaerofustis TaxID=264995 RepID=UPI001106BADF|nr:MULTISPECIES: DUF1858 domain-containing protein [Anaerofustis]MCO8193108.1 DUF1858 domain-containing protein [Anaerofustis sp. NSJ-163]
MKITKEMGIMDIVNKYPQAVSVFQAYGMGCVGCMAARFETLEEGAMAHGINVDELVDDLNENI